MNANPAATLDHTLSIGDYDYQMTREVCDVAHPLLLANDDRVFVPIHQGQRAGHVRQRENQERVLHDRIATGLAQLRRATRAGANTESRS